MLTACLQKTLSYIIQIYYIIKKLKNQVILLNLTGDFIYMIAGAYNKYQRIILK